MLISLTTNIYATNCIGLYGGAFTAYTSNRISPHIINFIERVMSIQSVYVVGTDIHMEILHKQDKWKSSY